MYPMGAGSHPTWAPDGKELVYIPGRAQMAAVSVTTRPAFTFSNPVALPNRSLQRTPTSERNYDIMPGKRILGVVGVGQNASSAPAARQIQVVLNWFEELKARVPMP